MMSPTDKATGKCNTPTMERSTDRRPSNVPPPKAGKVLFTKKPLSKSLNGTVNGAYGTTSSGTKSSGRKPTPGSTIEPATVELPIRWSDVAGARKSTHPDVAPIKRILAITEVCEAVLVQLSPIDIVKARVVCKTFRDVVDTSPTIKELLFLVRGKEVTPWVSVNNGSQYYTGKKAAATLATADNKPLKIVRPVIFNPILLLGSRKTLGLKDRLETPYSHHPGRNITLGLDMHKQWKWSGSSIVSDMYLSYPPVTSIFYSIRGTVESEGNENRGGLPTAYETQLASGYIENEEGLKWRDISRVVGGTVTCCGGRIDRFFVIDGFRVTVGEMVAAEKAGVIDLDGGKGDEHLR
ncbi:hypothetical protein MBLNU230_g5217t1 [Neophaeotheca triangularis]